MTQSAARTGASDDTAGGAGASASARDRILEATTRIIVEEGYDRLSMERVAERADVSRTTIYYQFGSRAGLLEALVIDSERRAEVEATRDEDHTVRDLLDRVMRIWEQDAEVVRAFMSMAVTDPESGEILERHRRGRRQRISELVDDFAAAGQLCVARDDVIDLLWMLTSFHPYDFLRHRTDRSPADVRRLLETLATSLVEPPALGADPS